MTYEAQQCELRYYVQHSNIGGQICFTVEISDGKFVLDGVEVK